MLLCAVLGDVQSAQESLTELTGVGGGWWKRHEPLGLMNVGPRQLRFIKRHTGNGCLARLAPAETNLITKSWWGNSKLQENMLTNFTNLMACNFGKAVNPVSKRVWLILNNWNTRWTFTLELLHTSQKYHTQYYF